MLPISPLLNSVKWVHLCTVFASILCHPTHLGSCLNGFMLTSCTGCMICKPLKLRTLAACRKQPYGEDAEHDEHLPMVLMSLKMMVSTLVMMPRYMHYNRCCLRERHAVCRLRFTQSMQHSCNKTCACTLNTCEASTGVTHNQLC